MWIGDEGGITREGGREGINRLPLLVLVVWLYGGRRSSAADREHTYMRLTQREKYPYRTKITRCHC